MSHIVEIKDNGVQDERMVAINGLAFGKLRRSGRGVWAYVPNGCLRMTPTILRELAIEIDNFVEDVRKVQG